MVASNPEARLHRLLAVAGHERTEYREAKNAIRGCRALLRSHPDLRDKLGLKVALTATAIELRQLGMVAAQNTEELREHARKSEVRNSDS